MARFKLGAAAALVLLVILVATAPARLVVPFLPADQVLLQGVSGSLWRGASSRAMVAVQGGYLHLGALSWTLSPLSLLTLGPTVTLESRWGAQRIDATLAYRSSTSMVLSDVDAVLPAMLVRQFVPLELSGRFAIVSPRLEIADGAPRAGSGRITWQDGGWVSPQGTRALGSYAIDFDQAAGGPLEGEVVTLAGALQAEGRIGLEGENYAIDILLSGRGLQDPQLQQALQLVAIPEGDRFRIRLQGALP